MNKLKRTNALWTFGMFAGVMLVTFSTAYLLNWLFPCEPTVKGYEEPSQMYQAPDGLWYPEPTLAE